MPGRIDMEELEIVCHDGLVILSGVLPSEGERSMRRHVVTDVLGIEEVVDHLQVEPLLWRREDRSKDDGAPRLGEGPAGPAGYGTNDTIESEAEVLDEVPPLGQPPAEAT
jgi:hypothetical protein